MLSIYCELILCSVSPRLGNGIAAKSRSRLTIEITVTLDFILSSCI